MNHKSMTGPVAEPAADSFKSHTVSLSPVQTVILGWLPGRVNHYRLVSHKKQVGYRLLEAVDIQSIFLSVLIIIQFWNFIIKELQ